MTRDTFKEKGVPVGVPVDVVREYLDARACYEAATRPPNSHAPAPVLKHDDPDAQRLREARVALDNAIAIAQQPPAEAQPDDPVAADNKKAADRACLAMIAQGYYWNGEAWARAEERPVAHTFYILHDATEGRKHIKKDADDGCLAIFEREEDAQRAKRRNSGTEYKRVVYYAAQQPAAEAVELTVCCGREECGGECGNEWRGMEWVRKDMLPPAEAQAHDGSGSPMLATPEQVGLLQGPDDYPHLQINGVSVSVFPAGTWAEVCEAFDFGGYRKEQPAAVDALKAIRAYTHGDSDERMQELHRIAGQGLAGQQGGGK